MTSGPDAFDTLAEAAAVAGMLRAGLSPREAFAAAGWGEPGADGAPPGAAPEFAVAARLAHASGAALAPVLEACAAAAREEAEAALARDAALAGPRLSARVLGVLPLAGIALAALVDVGVLRVLATPLGLALAGFALALTFAGRWWMARLVRAASPPPSATGVTLHAVNAAMAAGADVASALAAVGIACAGEPQFAGVGGRMQAVAAALAGGEPWVAAWEGAQLPALDRALRLPFERGAHAGPLLAAIAEGEALRRRRAASIAAGELAVRLTLPLALCLLPAFVAVGIVPLLVSLVGDG